MLEMAQEAPGIYTGFIAAQGKRFDGYLNGIFIFSKGDIKSADKATLIRWACTLAFASLGSNTYGC
jgi:hypothetical protein